MKKLLVLVSLICIMLGMGCVAASQLLTYANIDQDAVDYAVDAGVADVNDYDSWWPNIVLVERLEKDVDAGHNVIQLMLEQQIQRDNLAYSIHKDVVANDKAVSLQREKLLFGDTGLLSMGLSMMGFGSLTGLLGLMRKRPGDITAPEMEQALASATGKATADLSSKEKQFVQLVKGVQVFMDEYKDTTDNKEAVMLKTLKTALDAKQDVDTQAAVAIIKKTS